MNENTLFGDFVVCLREHLKPEGKRKANVIGKLDLVCEITGQSDKSQASRYCRMYAGEREPYWYHKPVIAQLISYAYKDVRRQDAPLVQRKGTNGYVFVGYGDDEPSVEVLGSAIDWARGLRLDFCLSDRPILTDSAFCKKMYELYEASYGGPGGHASDLENYVQAVDDRGDALGRTQEIYKRILLAVLLGPKAMPAIVGGAVTSQLASTVSPRVVDGFSLTQVSVLDGEMLTLNTLCYGLNRDVLIGLPSNRRATYSPVFPEGEEPYVSREHAIVSSERGDDGAPVWTLTNLSGSNGTAVRHTGGDIWYSKRPGEREHLQPGDEIWLAPETIDGESYPEYRRGAVVRIDCLYGHSRAISGGKGAVEEQAQVGDAQIGSVTPIYEGDARRYKTSKVAVGFELRDLTSGLGHAAYRYDAIRDDDGYFAVSIGRKGEFVTGWFFGSAVSKWHADIESIPDDWRVMLTNRSANTIVVRHVGGMFEELGEWECTTLADDDEIYLAGSVGGGGPLVDARGSVLSFRYIFRVG